jgi:hypothetical protein
MAPFGLAGEKIVLTRVDAEERNLCTIDLDLPGTFILGFSPLSDL